MVLVSLGFLVDASGPLAGLTGFAALRVSAAAVAMVLLRGVAAREGLASLGKRLDDGR